MLQSLIVFSLLALILRTAKGIPRIVRNIAFWAAISILLIATPNVLYRLIYLWEEPGQSHCATDAEADGIAILAGGLITTEAPSVRWSTLSLSTARRVEAAIEMYHRSTAPPRMIVLGVEVEVRTIGKILEGAGIRPELVVLEPAAPNTMAAAERLSEIAKEQQIGSLMTITSALHVRRSNLSLAKAGVSSCLTGVDHQYQDDQFTRFLPRPIEFTRADKLLHEVFGIIWYQFAK